MELFLEGIEKSFDSKEVLKKASYTFEKGRIYGLLGRNGAGKTTLFNCISREIEFEQGSVVLKEEGGEIPLDYDNIGYAFATPVLPEFLTGYEFIKFFVDINRKKIKEEKTVEEYADMVGLAHVDLDRLIKGYSHGMKNKLQMLCLLVSRPSVILLDEPLTSLDVVAAHEMKEMLLEMKKDHIIILSTHILQLAQDLCDEIVLLHQGVLTGVDEDTCREEGFEDRIIQLLTQEDDNDEWNTGLAPEQMPESAIQSGLASEQIPESAIQSGLAPEQMPENAMQYGGQLSDGMKHTMGWTPEEIEETDEDPYEF